jgi:hypothetical protein
MWTVVLILISIVVLLGLVRIIFFRNSTDFWGIVLEFFFIDVLDEWFD